MIKGVVSLLLAGAAVSSAETLNLVSREYYAWGYEPLSRLFEVKPLTPTG
jgi:hypothetical protein